MTRFHQSLAAAITLALAGSASAAGNPAAERALALVNGNRALVHASSADRFQARDVIVDADGTEHVRFDRSYGGLPVIGGDFVLHSRGSALRSASLTQAATLRLALKPSIPAADAIVAAGGEFGSNFLGMPRAELVVYARTATPLLAWRVGMLGTDADGNERDMTYIVSASDGRLLDRWSNIETFTRPAPTPTTPACSGSAATGLGKSLYLGNVSIGTTNCGGSFDMKDQGRGGAWTADLLNKTSGGAALKDADNTWGNNTISDRASARLDAHFGVARTWNFLKNVHARNGIGNDGKGALARVHYGLNYANASWSDTCFCMSFGDGNGTTYSSMVALDIAGHEMSHGVTSRTAKLTNSGESGGLSEATSDIFGTMVEFYANNPSDSPDYLIGEKVVIAGGGKALRYMFKPSRDGASVDCWTTTTAGKNPHYSSGVGNHFFYLLAQGAVAPAGYAYTPAQLVCNGNTALVAIGRAKAEKIWYRALTVYMTSSTNYAGARVATLNAARDLHGLNSTEYKAVAAAWSAVSVN